MINTVVWDFDGSMGNTQHIHATIESGLLRGYDVDISPDEITRRYAGVKDEEFFRDLLPDSVNDRTLKKIIEEKWSMMSDRVKHGVEPMPGALYLVNNFHKLGFKQAVASASRTSYVNNALIYLGVKDKMLTVVGGDQVSKGKPDPESFLLAAERIGAKPEEGLVIEDGYSGMVAAKRAGMKCIGLVGDEDRDYPADLLVLSLRDVKTSIIRSL